MPSHPGRPPHAPVEYERPQGVAFARTLRLLLLVTLVNTLLLGLNLAGMKPWDFAHQAYKDWSNNRAQVKAKKQRQQQVDAAQKACLEYTFDPGHVMYSEVPDEAMRLIADELRYRDVHAGEVPRGWQTPAIAKSPDCLDDLNTLHGTGSSAMGTLFLHQRAAPGGMTALIHAGIDARHEIKSERVHEQDGTFRQTYLWKKTRRLTAAASALHTAEEPMKPLHRYELMLVLPDNDGTTATTKSMPISAGQSIEPPPAKPIDPPPEHRLRFFGGQVDPADASHFTINYELDGKPSVIDGWFKDGGVLLRPRTGRLLPSSGAPHWELIP